MLNSNAKLAIKAKTRDTALIAINLHCNSVRDMCLLAFCFVEQNPISIREIIRNLPFGIFNSISIIL